MPITVKNSLSPSLTAMAARVELAAPAGADAMALVIERYIKQEITGGHPKGTKTGATPGGPPENVSGTLRRSVITGHPRLIGPGVASEEVGPTTVYARAQELGHPRWKDGVKYPYVKPGEEKAKASGEPRAAAARVMLAAMRG